MSENAPKRLKLSILKSSTQDNSKQVVKLFPLNGDSSQGTEATICKLMPVTYQNFQDQGVLTLSNQSLMTSPIQPLTRDTDIFDTTRYDTATIIAPTEHPPIGSILNTPQKPKPPAESYQSIFERRLLDMAMPGAAVTTEKIPAVGFDIYVPEPEFRAPREVVPNESIVQESVMFPTELIQQMISSAKVVEPDIPSMEEMASTIAGMAEMAQAETLMQSEVKEEVVPAPIPETDGDIISIPSDSEATEIDEDEIERLKTGYIEEASVYNDDNQDDEFSDFFDPPIGDEAHDKIVKEILEDKIKNLSKDQNPVNDILDEQMRKLTEGDGENVPPAPSASQEHVDNEQTVPTESVPAIVELPPQPKDQIKPDTFDVNNSACTSDTQSTPMSPPDKSAIEDNSNILAFMQRIEKRLQNIEDRITKIEEIQCPPKDEDYDSDELSDDDLVSLKFPVRKRGCLEMLENILKVPKMKRQLETRFQPYGGINEIDTIDMILAEILEPTLQESFKWRQCIDSVRSFENYVHINKLIFDCVKHHFRLITNVEYVRLMTLILNRPHRRSTTSYKSANKSLNSMSRASSVSSNSTVNDRHRQTPLNRSPQH